MAVFRNVTSNWNGWYKELKGGFYMVQDFILFYTTVTISKWIFLEVQYIDGGNYISFILVLVELIMTFLKSPLGNVNHRRHFQYHKYACSRFPKAS